MKRLLLGALAALAIMVSPVEAQNYVGGMVRTAVPTLPNGSINGLSLDANGYLKVNVSAGGGGGGGAVNLTQIGGNAVSNTTPGVLDVNCLSGCVAGSGVIQAQATSAVPSYTNATPNPVSQDLSGNLRVIVGNASIPVTGTFFQATQPVSNAGTFAVQAAQSGTWNIGTVTTLPALPANQSVNEAQINGVAPLMGNGVSGTGAQRVAIASDNTPFAVNANAVPMAAPATTSFHLIAAASTNSTLLSSGGHAIFELSTGNNSANIAYLKVYDKATAPTCGTDTPIGTYIIPGASAGGAGSNVNISLGKSVALGLGICVTGGIADADTTAVAASAYAIDVTYK